MRFLLTLRERLGIAVLLLWSISILAWLFLVLGGGTMQMPTVHSSLEFGEPRQRPIECPS
jgi:hypothetical protein